MVYHRHGNVVRRTAVACCVSKSPVTFCRCDAKTPKETKLETVVKARLGRPGITADKLTCSAIGTIVHSFYRTMKRASKCGHKKKRWRSWLLNWTVMTMKIPRTMETTSMAFLVDHFVYCPFVKPLELILDINSRKQWFYSLLCGSGVWL